MVLERFGLGGGCYVDVDGPQVRLAGSNTSPCVGLLRQHCDSLAQNLHTPIIANFTGGNSSAMVPQWGNDTLSGEHVHSGEWCLHL